MFLLLYMTKFTSTRCLSNRLHSYFQRTKSINNDHFLRYLSAIFSTNGERYINVTHTRLRHNCGLNYDLYRCIIMNNSLYSCGKAEDTFHKICFTCVKHADGRNALFNEIFQIGNLNTANTHVIPWGDCQWNISDNNHLFSLVRRSLKVVKCSLDLQYYVYFCNHNCWLC